MVACWIPGSNIDIAPLDKMDVRQVSVDVSIDKPTTAVPAR
jgi:hypothetical protein